MLVTDTNILHRCSRGNAFLHVQALRSRGVRLTTTDRNVAELMRKLVTVFGFSKDEAAIECQRVTAPFDMIFTEEYDTLREDAAARLGQGGKSDWPALAAAMALDAAIWSDDRDYFGVGVPVWRTTNVHFVKPDVDGVGPVR